MAEITRRVIGSTRLATGRLATLACYHKVVLATKFPASVPEDVTCDQCTALQRAIDNHIVNVEELKAMGVGSGRY